MHDSVMSWARSIIACAKWGRVLEVGSLDVNGSLRPHVDATEYIGVDILPGPSVDRIVSAVDLVATFGADSFNTVICTEMLEHADDWRRAVNNMKTVLKGDGHLLLTTRSVPFRLHNEPDYWRFSVEDMRRIFADFNIAELRPDTDPIKHPGVFIHARKPMIWRAADLASINVYSMAREKKR